MSNHANHPQRVFAASPKTPCHPSNGYAVNDASDEDASPLNNNIVNTAGSALAAKFDAIASGSMRSNDQHNERRQIIIPIRPQPQDPEGTSSVSVAEKTYSIMQEPTLKTGTKKRRGKSSDASTKVARRRSLRIQRRKSLCVEDEDGALSQREPIGEECEIKMTNEAKSALSQAMEVVAMDLAESSSLDRGQSEETMPSCNEDKEEEGNTTRRRANLKAKSVLETLDPMQKENSAENNDRVVKSSSRNKKRRDTFDLSRRRGLTRSGAVQSSSSSSNGVSSEMDICIGTDEADLKPQACNFNAADNTWTEANNMITPRNGNEVQLPFNDEPETEIVGSQVVKDNLKHLTSIDIEEKMQSLFSEFSVYNYPCVSARIFAVMSIVYEDKKEFEHLLPFLQSLINAEMVSLKSRTQSNEVYFINRKVCFSGFDYSATMPARDDIDGSHEDLNSSIAALENVLRQAHSLPHASHHLDVAIQCLHEMSNCEDVSEACSKTIVGFFPKSRVAKAVQHYLLEFQDIKSHLSDSSSGAMKDFDMGVRHRLGDFIGRSIRFNLRQILNTIPENMLDFNVANCEERWGRAVDDRSISSILNFALEKMNDLIANHEELFVNEAPSPSFFTSKTAEDVIKMPKKSIRTMSAKMYEELINDIKEARSFLLGIRACRFVWELLSLEGVDNHVNSLEGWQPIEKVASSFHDLNIFECSENKHFVLLRSIKQLLEVVEGPILNLETEAENAERYIQKLRKRLQPKKRESSVFNMKGSPIYNLRMCLHGEEEENFPQCLIPPKENL